MKQGKQQNQRYVKETAPSDLFSSIGFVKEKTPKPQSVPLNRYVFELFFELQRGDSLNTMYTADNLEHAFQLICEASKTEALSKMSVIIDYCFVYVFCDILVGDGKERAALFLNRQEQNVSKQIRTDMVPILYNVEPDQVDSVQEILVFNLRVPPSDFQPDFYFALNDFCSKCQSNCAIFLMRRFFHNKVPCEELLKPTQNGSNRTLELLCRTDERKPFFDEFMEISQLLVDPTQSKKPTPNKQCTPSLTTLLVPPYATLCTSDKYSNATLYAVGRELFYCNMPGKETKLMVMDEDITAISLSSAGLCAIACDAVGNVATITINDMSIRHFFSTRSLVTCCSFTPQLSEQFVVGTINGAVFVYHSRQYNPLRVFCDHNTSVTFIKVHPNGEYVVSASIDGIIRIWSVTLSVCVRLFSVSNKCPISCCFSHDGELLLVSCSKGYLAIFNIATGNVTKFANIEAQLVDADFSPNDTSIAVVDINGGFSLWNTAKLADDGSPQMILSISNASVSQVQYVGMNEIRVIGISHV